MSDIISLQEACLQEMDVDEFIRLDTEFHDKLYQAAKNNRLYILLNDLRDYMYRYRVILLATGERRRRRSRTTRTCSHR